MGKEIEYGTPLGWAGYLMRQRSLMIHDRTSEVGPTHEPTVKQLFHCRLDLQEMLAKLDEVGVPKTWEEMEKFEKQSAAGGTVDTPGSNPGAPTGA